MLPKRIIAAAAIVCGCLAAHAQLATPDPDWKEFAVPPPPVPELRGLIPVELPGSALRVGVMPASITIAAEGVVRYVMVATSDDGAINAMYEGIRCSTGEVRVYARHQPGGGWKMLSDDSWRPLYGNAAQRHSLRVARQGICMGNGINRDAGTIVRDLRSAPADRYNNESR